MILHSREKNKAMVVMVGMTIVMTMVSSIPMIRAETFDLKATLLKHREQHTNHLNKNVAYDHFRRLDLSRIEKLQDAIKDHERRLFEFGRLEEHEHRAMIVAKERHAKLLSETWDEKHERYAELHEAMQSEHTLGLSDLDFTLTGLK